MRRSHAVNKYQARTRVTIAYLHAGRDLVAKEEREQDAIEARIKAAQPIAINRDLA